MGVELGLSHYRKYLKEGEGFREECAEGVILDKEGVTGCWKNFIIRLHDFLLLLNIIRVIKSRRLRWAVYAVSMGRREMHAMFS
jgi:hypothetical protein